MSAVPRDVEMEGSDRRQEGEPVPTTEKKKKLRKRKKIRASDDETGTGAANQQGNNEPVGDINGKTKKRKKKKKPQNTAGVVERHQVGLVDTAAAEEGNSGHPAAAKRHNGVYRWGDHYHNDDHDTEDEDEFDDYDEKKFYFLFQFGAAWLYMTLVAISSAAPSWAQSSNGISDHSILVYNQTTQMHDVIDNLGIDTHLGSLKTQDMYNLWAHCHCYDTTRELCSTIRRFFIGGRIVSMLAVGGEFFVILIHCLVYAGFLRRYRRGLSWTAWTLCVLVTICLLVSFSTFSAAYARTWCGEKVSGRGFISWIYGLRITEFVAMVFISSGSWIQAKKQSKRFVKTIIWCVLLCFISGIVSTTARAWIQTFDGEREIGLWQACQCWSDDCNSETSYFESMEAFAIMSLISMGLFIVSYFLHISKKTQMPCLCFALFFNGIQLLVFIGWYYTGHCGDSSAFVRRYTIQWPLIVHVIAMFINCGMITNLTYRWCHSVV